MKKYNSIDLKEAVEYLDDFKSNPIIYNLLNRICKDKRLKSKSFTKVDDEYLYSLPKDETYIRRLTESDEYYFPGMFGLFEKLSDKLLRRNFNIETLYLFMEYNVELKRKTKVISKYQRDMMHQIKTRKEILWTIH